MAEYQVAKGVVFPFTVVDGSVGLSEELKSIASSLENILTWEKGTKLFDRNFGCDIFSFLNEPNDDIILNLIKESIRKGVAAYEKRITILTLDVARVDGTSIAVYMTAEILKQQKILQYQTIITS